MPRSSSPQAATRFAIPRTLVAGFVVAALATLVIAIVNFRSAEARAERRYKQLIDKGMPANMDDLLSDLRERDARDSQRAVAPLKRNEDAALLDTSEMTIQQAVDFVLQQAAALRS